MRSSRRTAAAAEATEGTAAGSGAPTLEMDPWKEDRVRDFVALNTIQRLRAYHLPSDAPMPPMEAVNVARARNLILLPRAVPDFRPCQLETKPKAAALRQRRRQQRAARTQAHVAKRAAHDNEEDHDGVSLTSSSMSTSSSQDESSSDDDDADDDKTHEEAEEEEEEEKEEKGKEGAGTARHKRGATAATDGNHVRYCALEKARVAFFGAASFTGSASPHRLLGSPHVPITPSRSTSTRASASGAKVNAVVPPSTTARPRLEEDLDARILAHSTPLKATEEASGTVLDGTPVLQATAPEDASPSPQKLFAEPAADEAEARAAPAEEAGEEETQDETSASSPAFDGERFGCEVCDALHQYFQSLLTRGVVLDRFNHKDLAFAWWVLGRNMDTAALDHVGPLRREPLLISLRNYYFNLLTKHEAKKRARQQRRAAAQAKSQGESPHQPQQQDGEAEAKQGPQPTTQAATDGMAPPPEPLPHAGAKRRRSDAGHPARAPAKSTRRQASPASSASQPSSSASSRSGSRSPRVVPQDASGSGDGVERMLLDGVDLSQLPPASSRASSTTSNRRSAQERRQAVEDTWSSVRQGRHRPTSSTTSVAMADGEKEPVPIVSGAGVPSKKTTPVPGPTPRAPATTTKSAKKPAAATASKAAPPPPPSSPAPPATAKASGGSSTTATNSSGPKSPTPSSQANRKGTSSAVSVSTTTTATTAGATSNSKKKTDSHAKTSAAAETTQTASHAKATPAQATRASRAVSESTTATTTDATTAAVDTTTATATATATTAPSRAKKGKTTSTTATTNSSQATTKGPSETEASSSPTAGTVAEAAVVAAEVPGTPTPSHAPAVAPADHAQCLTPLLQLSAFQTSVEDRIQGRLGTAEDSLYAFLMGSATHQRDVKGRPIVPKPTPALASGTEGRSTTQKEPHEETAAAGKSNTMGTTSSASASAPQAKGRRGRHKLNNRGAVDPSLFLSTCRYDHGAFEAELARRASARAESHKRPRQEEETDEDRRIKEESETPRAAPQNSSRRENLADALYPLPLSRRYDAAGHRLPHSFTPVMQAEVMAAPLHTAACLHPLPEPPHTHSLRSLPYAQQCLLVWEAASRIECFAEAQAERERQKAALLSTMRMTTRRMRATIEESEPSAVVAKMKKRARRTKALSERGAEPAEEEDEESTPWQAAPRLPAEHEEESEETSESEPDNAPPSATPSPLPHQPSASSGAPHTSATVKVKRERDGASDRDQHGRHTSVSSTASHEHASAAAALTGQPARCYIDYWAYYRPS